MLLAITIVPALVALAWFTLVFAVYPPNTAVVFRFGQPHREVHSGLGLRFPAPVEEVRYVDTGVVNVTQADLQPKNKEAHTGRVLVQWQVGSATDFLLNAHEPQMRVKEAVETVSRDLAPYHDLHGRLPCALTTRAQAHLDASKLGIRLLMVCRPWGAQTCAMKCR